jgi:hypothetical protein
MPTGQRGPVRPARGPWAPAGPGGNERQRAATSRHEDSARTRGQCREEPCRGISSTTSRWSAGAARHARSHKLAWQARFRSKPRRTFRIKLLAPYLPNSGYFGEGAAAGRQRISRRPRPVRASRVPPASKGILGPSACDIRPANPLIGRTLIPPPRGWCLIVMVAFVFSYGGGASPMPDRHKPGAG